MDSTIELRLGNLVKVKGKTYQVASLDSCFVGLSEVGKDALLLDVDVKDVEPIELTTDIVLKSMPGVVITAEDKYNSHNEVFIHHNESTNEFRICMSVSMFDGLMINTILTLTFSTVHEFQNAYRGFLKQEVDIKNLI
jgi:hypothetical protein